MKLHEVVVKRTGTASDEQKQIVLKWLKDHSKGMLTMDIQELASYTKQIGSDLVIIAGPGRTITVGGRRGDGKWEDPPFIVKGGSVKIIGVNIDDVSFNWCSNIFNLNLNSDLTGSIGRIFSRLHELEDKIAALSVSTFKNKDQQSILPAFQLNVPVGILFDVSKKHPIQLVMNDEDFSQNAVSTDGWHTQTDFSDDPFEFQELMMSLGLED